MKSSHPASQDHITETVNHTLLEMGKSVSIYRRQVLRKTQQEFTELLGISEPTLRKMEKGDAGVSIGTWLRAFQIMQVDKSVLSASRPEHLILAAMFQEAESPANKSDKD